MTDDQQEVSDDISRVTQLLSGEVPEPDALEIEAEWAETLSASVSSEAFEPRSGSRVQALTIGDVRWFYKSSSKRKLWLPLTSVDSLNVETEFRRRTAEKDASVAKKGPSFAILDDYYKVDFERQIAVPIYWDEGEPVFLKRGTWFVCPSFQPLDERVSDKVDSIHMKSFAGKLIPPSNSNLTDKQRKCMSQLISLDTTIGTFVWYEINEVFLVKAPVGRWSRIVQRNTSHKVQRGYHTIASHEDQPYPVRHLMFLIHGIGQMRRSGIIFSNAEKMRTTYKHIRQQVFDNAIPRIMFLGVEWRCKLSLNDETVDKLTLPRLPKVRRFLNRTALDILYYITPLYQAEICASVVTEINSQFKLFLEHNPKFLADGGQVSIVGHSLGSVIMYDLVNGWPVENLYNNVLDDKIRKMSSNITFGEQKSAMADKFLKLKKELEILERGVDELLRCETQMLPFKINKLFMLGSPLGVFLSLRNFKQKQLICPSCQSCRIYNIHHPTDPIAYRVEPLLVPNPGDPVSIAKWSCDLKHYRKRAKSVSSFTSENSVKMITDSLSSEGSSKGLASSKSKQFTKTTDSKSSRKTAKAKIFKKKITTKQSSSGRNRTRATRSRMSGVNLSQRLDFGLPPGGRTNEIMWWKAHFSYWSNLDCMRFIVECLLASDSRDFHSS